MAYNKDYIVFIPRKYLFVILFLISCDGLYTQKAFLERQITLHLKPVSTSHGIDKKLLLLDPSYDKILLPPYKKTKKNFPVEITVASVKQYYIYFITNHEKLVCKQYALSLEEFYNMFYNFFLYEDPLFTFLALVRFSHFTMVEKSDFKSSLYKNNQSILQDLNEYIVSNKDSSDLKTSCGQYYSNRFNLEKKYNSSLTKLHNKKYLMFRFPDMQKVNVVFDFINNKNQGLVVISERTFINCFNGDILKVFLKLKI